VSKFSYASNILKYIMIIVLFVTWWGIHKSQNLRNAQTPTAMYLPCCLNVAHLTISFVLWCLCYVVFILSSFLCALPHTILPWGHISISCFCITCLLLVLRSFAQWNPAWKVIFVILCGMADLNQNIEWSWFTREFSWIFSVEP
jgi:hypothetical protein